MTCLEYPRGSEWRKWDLHVHTPASIVNSSYPGPDPWEAFLADLEALPPEFKVIGINDYLFIDGYKRVREEKSKGRLANIDLILPVIELRLDKFGGSSGHLSRVNYHVIFSDEISPEVIEQQFLNSLCSKYVLSPQYDYIKKNWAAVATKESLTDLGNLIINSAPPSERHKYSTPLKEGFNNLCLNLEAIHSSLASHYFEGKYLTAVGKTEWADIKWNDHSIADKKNIINGVDFVFISAESVEAWNLAKSALAKSCVNSRLLDCSDAHSLSTAGTKDRIGNCFTWIKADPTFQGLGQLLHEPETRIFVSDKTSDVSHFEINATKYMSAIQFERTDSAKEDEIWFSGNIPLNHGLIAIIGNKGSGKSALADILALLGNTHSNHFSFLNNKRFLKPKEKLGGMFSAKITWKSGQEVSRRLDKTPDHFAVELVKYIPQKYLESICSELKESNETQFDLELMDVIFSHVNEAERLGKETLSELISYLTNEKEELISQLVGELEDINSNIVSLEDQLTEEYRKSLESQLSQCRSELKAHEETRPLEVKKPNEDMQAQETTKTVTSGLLELQTKATRLENEFVSKKETHRKATLKIAAAGKLLTRINNLERQMTAFYNESFEDSSILEIDIKEIVILSVNHKLVLDVQNRAEEWSQAAKESLNENIEGSLANELKVIRSDIEVKHQQLNEPNRRYQNYLKQLKEWEKKREEITGSFDNPKSIKGLESKLTSLLDLPVKLSNLKEERKKLVREIFVAKEKLLADYKKLYSPVQEFIDTHPKSKEHGALQFFASIMVDGFVDGILEMINKGRKGSFQGEHEGRERLKGLVSKNDFSTEAGIQAFLGEVQKNLNYDMRDGNSNPVLLRDQLRHRVSPEDVYNFLYGLKYLEPRFELRWHNKPLDQLSPGERGNLLLVFYLLIDKRDVPLIIDQPEENLDNETIATTLVPAINYAKERRQIIIVTHNPNLAVVCDADQIIHARIDKTDGNRIVYTSGAIENPKITKLIVDVLEGTKPAFDKRDAKYEILEKING
jgi:ABC-type lipoprotein export system ATPase subunit